MGTGEERILQEISKRIDKLINVSGISFTDVVDNRNLLPITLGTPLIGSLYLVSFPLKTLFNTITIYPAGIYTKMNDTGNLTDWVNVPVKFDFKDTNFLLYDDGDNTKQTKFELSSLTQLRTLTIQDKDGIIALHNDNISKFINDVGYTNDQTPLEIKIAYESNANTNAFTDTEKTKLAGLTVGVTEDDVIRWTLIMNNR